MLQLLQRGKLSQPSAELLINKKKLLGNFEKQISHKFRNKNLLLMALTHSSFAKNTYNGRIADNERLEFLGDAILQAAVSDFLIGRFPDYDEGDLSKARASMVNRHTLALLGNEMAIGSYLIVGKSISKRGDFHSSSLIADALEALIGAIYLDGGFEKAKLFVSELFSDRWNDVEQQRLSRDYKSMAQELFQKKFNLIPRYDVIGEFGDNHERRFEVEVIINGTSSRGTGKNKKDAEQEAARNALLALMPECFDVEL